MEEALSSAKIEGEILRRDSVQSSLQKNLGLKTENIQVSPEEFGMAEMMSDVFLNFAETLTHKSLHLWHKMLCNGRRDLNDIGKYRTHADPMQIVSANLNNPVIFYEAPPSEKVPELMTEFIKWYNHHAQSSELPVVVFASIVHLYFEQIHPFEDGNGRIGRAICEKAVSLRLGFPALITLSKAIEKERKAYYEALLKSNSTLNAKSWLDYHTALLLTAQDYAQELVNFSLQKAKIFQHFSNALNERQTKVLRRIFDAGPEGFIGGLSAKNYQSITQAPSATATRDLADLVEKGILRKEGVLKGTRYYLN